MNLFHLSIVIKIQHFKEYITKICHKAAIGSRSLLEKIYSNPFNYFLATVGYEKMNTSLEK